MKGGSWEKLIPLAFRHFSPSAVHPTSCTLEEFIEEKVVQSKGIVFEGDGRPSSPDI